jgi:hypothetical protein
VLDGEVAVPCTRNPLQRGRIPARGYGVWNRSGVWDDEGWVPRDGRLRTPSGPEGSSGKEVRPGAAGVPGSSLRRGTRPDAVVDGRCTAAFRRTR